MSVSVVIPVTRTSEIRRCLERLIHSFQKAGVLNYEILIIKDPLCDLSFPLFKEHAYIRILNCDSMHPSIRRNYGVRLATHEIIAFIDDDVYVFEGWVENVLKSIPSCDGVCGPIIQSRFKSVLKNVVGLAQESFFSEGFNDHRNFRDRTRFFDIPLCNVVIHRKIWDAVHGFNEVADYNVDDCEFFYLAEKKGFEFFNEPGLAVEHDLLPLGWAFFRKKAQQRFRGGINSIIFKEIYFTYSSVRLVWLSYILLFLLLTIQFVYPFSMTLFLKNSMSIYGASALVISLTKVKNHPLPALLLPFVFFVIHIVDYFSYTFGVLYYFIFQNQFRYVMEHKKKRMAYYATEI